MNIYVANLNYSVSSEQLQQLFEGYGEVTSAKVILDHKNALPIECDPDVLKLKYTGVKCPKFSFKRLGGSDPILGLEMSSTGESGCIGYDAFDALLKSLLSTDIEIPEYGNIIIVSEMEKALRNYSLFFKYLIPKGYNFYYFSTDKNKNDHQFSQKLCDGMS
jgi:hypothetical protein